MFIVVVLRACEACYTWWFYLEEVGQRVLVVQHLVEGFGQTRRRDHRSLRLQRVVQHNYKPQNKTMKNCKTTE